MASRRCWTGCSGSCSATTCRRRKRSASSTECWPRPATRTANCACCRSTPTFARSAGPAAPTATRAPTPPARSTTCTRSCGRWTRAPRACPTGSWRAWSARFATTASTAWSAPRRSRPPATGCSSRASARPPPARRCAGSSSAAWRTPTTRPHATTGSARCWTGSKPRSPPRSPGWQSWRARCAGGCATAR